MLAPEMPAVSALILAISAVTDCEGSGALFERGEAYDKECGVGKRHAIELAEADDRGEGGDALSRRG